MSYIKETKHCDHECVCDLYSGMDMKGERCPSNQHPKNPCKHDTRARAPVAQQAPALNTQPEGTTCEDCLRFRESECPYPGSNITMNKCNSFLLDIKRHDAALIAQEREKWERESDAPETKQAYRNGFDEGFEIGKAQCETHHQEIKEEAAAQERGDVLDLFLDEIRKEDFENCGFVDMDSIEAIYIRLKESLRHGQKQECEPE